jgi:hypothetical protein
MIKRLRLTALIAALVFGGYVLALQVRVALKGDGITTIRPGAHTSVGFKPLTEMIASDRYKGEDGGLYGGGRNTPPESHVAAAKEATAKIRPLDVTGHPAANGTIAFVSISMSNATQEFSAFKQLADTDPQRSRLIRIVDCAQNGQAMAQWVDPTGRAWTEADRRLQAAQVGAAQVQIAWIKLANVRPTGGLRHHGRKLYTDTLTVLHNAKQRFPNLRTAYLASRIYAGYSVRLLNPEPYAYEGAFVVRWLIRDQIQGDDELRYAEGTSPVKAPLLLWGPYLWADGTTPRKDDRLIWERNDFAEDGVHPSESGRRKVADMLLNFFKTDSLAATWFVKSDNVSPVPHNE